MQRLSGGRLHVAVALALCSSAVAIPVAAQQSMPTPGQQIGGAAAPGQLGMRSGRSSGTLLGVFAGGSWSDNIERTAAAEEDGTIATVGVLVGHHQETRRFITSIDANVAYEDYVDDNFDSEIVGGAAAGLTAHLVPDRFLWVFEDNFGQATSDPFAAPTPETRENINVFTTGPDLLLGAGGTTLLHLSGRYTNTQYETSPIDSERYTALIALVRRLSQTSSISLNFSGAQVTVDEASLGRDYDQYEGYLHFETEGARTILSVDAGYTMLDIGDESPGGVLLRASATRRLSPSSSVSLRLGSQFSDSAELFRMGQQRGGASLDTSSALTTNDPFENRFVSLSYDFLRNRTAFGFGVEYSDEDYESAESIDRKLTTWGVYASRRLTPMVELRVFGDYEIEDFEGISFEDKELDAGAYLSWQVGRMTSVRLQYNRFDRKSTSATTEYEENRVSLFFTWTPISSQ